MVDLRFYTVKLICLQQYSIVLRFNINIGIVKYMSNLVGIYLSINKLLLKNIIFKNMIKVKCYLELLNINLKNIFYIIIIKHVCHLLNSI